MVDSLGVEDNFYQYIESSSIEKSERRRKRIADSRCQDD